MSYSGYFTRTFLPLGNLSSISSMSSEGMPSLRPKTSVPEQLFTDSNLQMLGYGQSMFLSENILNNAAEKHGIPIDVLRCGQIGGPAGHGKKQWNSRNWFPLLVQTSKALGLIPIDLELKTLFNGFQLIGYHKSSLS